MRDPPDTDAEEAALARHSGSAAELGDGPLWWNSVAAQNHAAQMRSSWVKEELSKVHGPGGGPGRTGNSGMRGTAFQREVFDISHHAWKHDDSRKVKGRHKKRDVKSLKGQGTLTGEALENYMGALCNVRDGYYAAGEELVHKAAQVTPMRQLRATGTHHEREFAASTHRHDDVERRRDLDCKPSNILNGEGTAENADMELKVKPCATMAGAPATHVIAYMSF